MTKPILEDIVSNRDNPINCQEKIPRGEEVDVFSIQENKRRLPINKITCWELVAEVQMKVDVESVCETKVTTNDDNVGEGGEQKWRDIWNDMNCLQFIQIAQTPFSDIDEEILWIKKQAQNYVWKGQYQLCF